ncbi:ferric reductase-like transmembrane domain-containing protein [Nocardioides korecus]
MTALAPDAPTRSSAYAPPPGRTTDASGPGPSLPARRTAPLGRTARLDAGVRLASMAGLWLSLLLVTYWWDADGGIRDLTGWATGLVSVGRLSGLVASVLLLAQVLLMARLPVVERAFGQDRLAHVHRLVGFTSFNLMVLHIVTITWGYAAGSLLASPRMLWNLTVDYPGMLLAAAGSLALVMVVVTSVKAARRRLRYESWHLMHLYAYLGVGLALPHQLWTGQQFTGSATRTVFWWTAWAATAAAVLVWRLGVPVVRNLRHQLRVADVVDEGEGVWSVHVTGRRLDRLRVEAGQFFSWRFLTGRGWSRANPYSLSAAPDGRTLRITVQGVGDGSQATRGLRPGTRVLVEGPHGRLSSRPRTRRKVALIGAGVGTTPLRALAEGLAYDAGEAVYLERFTDTPLFAAEIDRIARDRGLQVLRLPGRRRAADSWLGSGMAPFDDLSHLLHWVPDIAERDVYVCGPEPWGDLVTATLRACGLPDDHLHLETFAW